jgi:hypothetical protein
LRGATDFTLVNTPDGEVYLAVAQSVCEPLTRCTPPLQNLQPTSSLLQWDRVAGSFTEMLAMTDEASMRARGIPVPDQHIRVHQTALRVPVGRARRWTAFLESKDEMLLVASSEDMGTLIYRMNFEEYGNLLNSTGTAIHIAANQTYVYVLSSNGSAVTTFSFSTRFDALGKSTGYFTRVQAGIFPGEPLQGVRGLWYGSFCDWPQDLANTSTAPANATEASGACIPILAVRSGAPKDALVCGPTLPIPVTALPGDVNPACVKIPLTTRMANITNPLLFAVAPYIVSEGPERGSLRFTVRDKQVGMARFRVAINSGKEGNATSAGMPRRLLQMAPAPQMQEAEFEVHVLDVNQPPRFSIVNKNISIPEGTGKAITILFATNISAEGLGVQGYEWEWWVYYEEGGAPKELGALNEGCFSRMDASTGVRQPVCGADIPSAQDPLKPIFLRAPEFVFDVVNGTLGGYLIIQQVTRAIGTVNFFVRMHDGSPESERGGGNVSGVQGFNLTVLRVNHAPVVIVKAPQLSFQEDNGTDFIFVPNIFTYPDGGGIEDADQVITSVTLSRMYSTSDPRSDLMQWVSFFKAERNLAGDYDVTMGLKQNFNGEATVVVKIQDNGGTALGGVDTSYYSFDLSVTPVNDMPVLVDNGRNQFRCKWTAPNVLEEPLSAVLAGDSNSTLAAELERGSCAFAIYEGLCNYLQPRVNRTSWLRNKVAFEALGLQGTIAWKSSSAPSDWGILPVEFPKILQYEPTAEGFMYIQREPGVGDIGDFALLFSPILPTSYLLDNYTLSPGISVNNRRREFINELSLDFLYAVWGYSVGSLSLEVRVLSDYVPGSVVVGGWTTVWTRSGDQGQAWFRAHLNLTKMVPGILSVGKHWQMRFRAVRGSDSTSEVIALQGVRLNGRVVTLDDRETCNMYLYIQPSGAGAVRMVPGAFVLDAPPDELISQTVEFAILSYTAPHLFSAPPRIFPNGTAIFHVEPNAEGVSAMTMRITDSLNGMSGVYPFTVVLGRGSGPPSFKANMPIITVDSTRAFQVSNFAVVDPTRTVQPVTFDLTYSTTAPGLFVIEPHVDTSGTLHMQASLGYAGIAYCNIGVAHDEGRGNGPVSTLPQDRYYFEIRVRAQPHLQLVQPFFGAVGTQMTVTIYGRNFGSESTRGYSAPTYNLTGYVRQSADGDWQKCLESTYVGDTQMLCVVPPGTGARDVMVQVSEDSVRAGTLRNGLLSIDVWVGGSVVDDSCASIGAPWPHEQDAKSKCAAQGFVGGGAGEDTNARMAMVPMNISAAVRSVVSNAGR